MSRTAPKYTRDDLGIAWCEFVPSNGHYRGRRHRVPVFSIVEVIDPDENDDTAELNRSAQYHIDPARRGLV